MALSACESSEIKRCKNLSKEDFDSTYLDAGVPVVIENGTSGWPARNWTLDGLCERVGPNEVYVRTNTNCEEYRKGTQYKIRQTTFQKYVDDLLARNARGRSSYLAVQNIKKAFPQIEADVPIPEYVGKIHGGPFLWVAMEGHYEYCHQDPDDGLLVMIQGSKQVRLFGTDMEHMYPHPLGSKGRTTQSAVDCNNPDLVMHPAFVGAWCRYTTLHPGDVLYIPAFCWHQVTTLQTSISINMFWGNAGKRDYITKIMAEPVWPAFSHWLLNVIEQNQQCESFPRILARLPEALRNFFMTQWHEEPSHEQLEVLTKYIMAHLKIESLPKETINSKFPPKLQIRGLLWRS